MVWRFLKKLRIQLPYNPAAPPLAIYHPNFKIFICKHICTSTFTVVLFMVAKTETMYPLTDDRIKMCCTYTTGYYSALTKDEMLPFVTTWMDLENIMLSEMSDRKN